jgi:hypothetical protein
LAPFEKVLELEPRNIAALLEKASVQEASAIRGRRRSPTARRCRRFRQATTPRNGWMYRSGTQETLWAGAPVEGR